MDKAFASFFDTKLKYERNNRSDGCKALSRDAHRCFPDCHIDGHQTKGFCGRQACVDVYITSEKPESFWSSEIIAVAQLRPSSGEGLSSRQSISKEELLGSLRTPINHIFSSSGNNYFLGDITVSTMKQQENKVISIIFNHERTAWHYGWTSSKWVQDATHVMDVVILEDKGGFSLDIIGSFVSNEFGITSTKKRRNDIKMESRKKEGVIKAKTGKKRSRESVSSKAVEEVYSPDSVPHNSSSSTKELTLSDKAVSAKKISKSAKIKKRETKDVFLFAPPSNSNCGNMIHTISSSPQHIDAFQAVSGDEEVGSIATDAHTSRQDWSMFLNLPEGEEVLKVYHL